MVFSAGAPGVDRHFIGSSTAILPCHDPAKSRYSSIAAVCRVYINKGGEGRRFNGFPTSCAIFHEACSNAR